MKLSENAKDRIVATIVVSLVACALTVWVNNHLYAYRLSIIETKQADLQSLLDKEVTRLDQKYEQGIAEIGVRLRSIEHSIVELTTILKERSL